jgi:hypothetical protein
MSYKGLAFFAKSDVPLRVPEAAEVVTEKDLISFSRMIERGRRGILRPRKVMRSCGELNRSVLLCAMGFESWGEEMMG